MSKTNSLEDNNVVLHPFVLWGQKDQNLHVTVQLQGVTEPIIQLTESGLKFVSRGFGCHGETMYQFDLDFYLPIKRKLSSWSVKEKSVDFHILKENNEIWPRITCSKKKLPWLRVNFDMLQFSDDSDEENKEPSFPRWEDDVLSKQDAEEEKLKAAFSKDMKNFISIFKNPLRMYLLLYNLFQLAGYIYVFHCSVYKFLTSQDIEQRRLIFESVKLQLCVVQLASFFEVFHALLGWVRSGVVTTAMQVLGRNMVLFLLLLPCPDIQKLTFVFWLVISWSAIELFRFPYYILGLWNEEVGWITWLRYTAWIPLYPLGFVCEGLVMLTSLPRIMEQRWYSLSLPNKYNFSFDFALFLQIYMCLFLVGAYILMTHMYSQRKRKLGIRSPSLLSRWGLSATPSSAKNALKSFNSQKNKDIKKM